MNLDPVQFSPSYRDIRATNPDYILREYAKDVFVRCDAVEGHPIGESRVYEGDRDIQYASTFNDDRALCDNLKDDPLTRLKWKFDSIYGMELDNGANEQRAVCVRESEEENKTKFLILHYYSNHAAYDEVLDEYRWRWCYANRGRDRIYRLTIDVCIQQKLAIKGHY